MLQDTPAASVIPVLEAFATLLSTREHKLARGGDDKLAGRALDAVKDICDLGIATEASSHPHIHPFLASIVEQPTIQLRSSKPAAEEETPAPEELLPYTPLSELTVAGMEPEQVWAQLELRAEGLCRIIKEVAQADADEEEGSVMGWEEEEDDDDDSTEEMTIEEWEKMMAEGGYEEGMSDEGSEKDSDEGSDEEDDEELGSDEDVEMGSGSDGELELGSDEEGSLEDEDDDGASDAQAEDEDDGYAPGPSKPRAQHPTLDDKFFSIDDFNRQTEEMEAGRVTSGALGGDEDEEGDLDDIGTMFLEEGEEDDAPLMYSDFFAPPPRPTPKAEMGKDKGQAKDGGKKKSKRKVAFAEDEDEDEPAEAEEDPSRGVMDRLKADLFDDSEDEGDSKQVMSTHERRQRELAEQIAQLEAEAIGPKDWTLLGEASSRARPENSLLEEDLDFEHVAKSVPNVTEESVASLEELIRKRILDNNFDSVERVRAYDPTPFLPSRFFELDDKQSAKSLAQIYEDDYTTAASGGKAVDARDAKLKAQHDEIDTLWGDICYKLDALSSLNFVPKAPKAQIRTVENIATTSMESALPSTQAAGSMLAPQEMFAGPSAGELTARDEQNPEEAKAARAKARREKKSQRAKLAGTEALYSKKKSVREQKNEALKSLVKTGKGVTVLGKGGKEDAKRKQRAEAGPDAKRLKL
ncbi:hypothetical protein CspHIS471_0207710 [Cutaneotrichosporon sp. HIS471]|nr:hypothetical protein CspHIS471_0207710 [Cutaneotrichosporon sp. HIS471]